MASHATNAHRSPRNTLVTSLFATALGLASIAIGAAGQAHAQEPAPATAPPPPSWGGAAPAPAPEPAPATSLSTTSSSETSYNSGSSTNASGTPGTEQPGGLKDASPQDRPMMISAFTGLHFGHFSGYGFPMMIGGRFSIPIVPNGFIPSLNDEFGLEFGMDFHMTFLSDVYADSVLFGFGIPADAMWDFHFTPRFDAYAKIGFVLGSVFNEGYGGFWWDFRSAVGLRLKLNDVMYFRAEVGYPALMAGLGFAL